MPPLLPAAAPPPSPAASPSSPFRALSFGGLGEYSQTSSPSAAACCGWPPPSAARTCRRYCCCGGWRRPPEDGPKPQQPPTAVERQQRPQPLSPDGSSVRPGRTATDRPGQRRRLQRHDDRGRMRRPQGSRHNGMRHAGKGGGGLDQTKDPAPDPHPFPQAWGRPPACPVPPDERSRRHRAGKDVDYSTRGRDPLLPRIGRPHGSCRTHAAPEAAARQACRPGPPPPCEVGPLAGRTGPRAHAAPWQAARSLPGPRGPPAGRCRPHAAPGPKKRTASAPEGRGGRQAIQPKS